MQLEARKYLQDVSRALELLGRFAQGKTLAEYRADPLLRSAVERQFEIVGVALNQLHARDAATAARIPELARIVGFRNILISGTRRSTTNWCGMRSPLASPH